jgi:hypothetical protein
MFRLFRITLFALPLAGGVAWAQGSGTSGSAGAPGAVTPPVTGDTDTRTAPQQKAGRLDDTTPALPGDATKPVDIPNTVRESDRAGLPDRPPAPKATKPKKDVTPDTTKMQNKVDRDVTRDPLNSDK